MSALFFIDEGIRLGDAFGEFVCAGEVLLLWEIFGVGRYEDVLSSCFWVLESRAVRSEAEPARRKCYF